ncbi:MAG: KpsF/GutQ family sugar-phosphate isomerase [Pseudomonadota bacterium]|nr:KpsF/GutQ family sugar-phosphate isomerase [Pseudomonadota bacterium]
MTQIEQILNDAKEVFEIESRELLNVKDSLTDSFANAVLDILNAKGKCIITGMGKSGIIGRKIAASLSSTGTSSFFVHPGEAFHGDLGMFEKDDIVIMLSNSGETDEVLKLMSFFKYQGNKTISITSNQNSTLAKNTTHHILCKVEKEACPLQLAPTSSTTAALTVGDAIVVSLINLRQFKPENFARFHPGGSLGKKLLATVEDLMVSIDLPIVKQDTCIKDVIHTVSKSGLGFAVQVDKERKVTGVITDGDIRRAMDKYQEAFFTLNANNISNKKPVIVTPGSSLAMVEELFDKSLISNVIVTEKNNLLLGVISLKQINL